jgi:hypothetical protein
MDRSNVFNTNRRDFFASIVPAYALTCLASQRLIGSVLYGEVSLLQEDEQKFEKEMNRKITCKR